MLLLLKTIFKNYFSLKDVLFSISTKTRLIKKAVFRGIALPVFNSHWQMSRPNPPSPFPSPHSLRTFPPPAWAWASLHRPDVGAAEGESSQRRRRRLLHPPPHSSETQPSRAPARPEPPRAALCSGAQGFKGRFRLRREKKGWMGKKNMKPDETKEGGGGGRGEVSFFPAN